MKWNDIANVIGKVAPAIGTMIAGPAGAAVGEGLSIALGVANKPDAVAEALKTDPDAFVKIKQYQIEHKYDLEKLHLQAVSDDLADTQNARNRQNAGTLLVTMMSA